MLQSLRKPALLLGLLAICLGTACHSSGGGSTGGTSGSGNTGGTSGGGNTGGTSGTGKHSVTLTWNASTSSGVTGYNLYRDQKSGGPYSKLNASLISGLTYKDTTVAKCTTYYYVATAVNSSNAESSYSKEVKAVIPCP